MDAHPNAGALILHCFWAELFYAHLMRGDILTPERMKAMSESLAADQADKLFGFGHSARREMRASTSAFTEEDWEKNHEVEGRGYHLEGSARKLIAHILVHEIRHWAQIAILVHQHDLAPPGEHDLLFSTSFGPLVKKI